MFAANHEFDTRTTLAGLIAARLHDAREDLRKQWFSGHKVRSFVLDDLLRPSWCIRSTPPFRPPSG